MVQKALFGIPQNQKTRWEFPLRFETVWPQAWYQICERCLTTWTSPYLNISFIIPMLVNIVQILACGNSNARDELNAQKIGLINGEIDNPVLSKYFVYLPTVIAYKIRSSVVDMDMLSIWFVSIVKMFYSTQLTTLRKWSILVQSILISIVKGKKCL